MRYRSLGKQSQIRRLFNVVYEKSPIGIAIYNSDGHLLDTNQACLDIFGVSSVAELKGFGFELFKDQKLSAEGKERLRKGETVRCESVFQSGNIQRTTKTRVVYLDVIITPLSREGKKPQIGYLVQAIDITERKLAEERLRRSEKNLEDIIENIPAAITLTTPERKVTAMNQAVWKILGYESKEEWSNIPLSDHWVDPKDRDRYYELAERGAVKDYEARLKRKDGTIFWASITSVAQKTETGSTQYLRILQDVTPGKMVEEEKLNAMSKVARSIAHDIRNPLSTIRTASYLRRTCEEEKKLGILKAIDHNVVYADMLVKNLIDFSSPPPLNLVEEDANALIQETLAQIIIPDPVKLTVFYGKIPSIKFDMNQLMRALTNLIVNAIQAMSKGGDLVISTELLDGSIEIKIKDTGVGMSKKELERIFEPFFTTKAKGVGLGLINAKNVIEGHGGTLILESEEQKGTTAIVRLPISTM